MPAKTGKIYDCTYIINTDDNGHYAEFTNGGEICKKTFTEYEEAEAWIDEKRKSVENQRHQEET